MRRKDREVTCEADKLAILDECKVCRVALQDEQGLYIVPMNFGYQYESGRLTLYFHSAKSGRKITALQKSDEVAFEMDCRHCLIEAGEPCRYGYAFASITGSGVASFVQDDTEKKQGLSLLMRHQTGKDFCFDSKMADTVSVFKITVSAFSAKKHDFLPIEEPGNQPG